MSNNKEIMQKVESGEYFAEARDWYIRKYVYNFIERSYLLVVLAFMLFLMFLSLSYYWSILPIKKDMPIQVNITDTAEQYAKLTYLGNSRKNFNVNHVISKYLSKRFVEAFESYDYKNNFEKLDVNRSFIETLGTEGIKRFYLDRTSIRSKNSLILKYRQNVVREIFVDEDSIFLTEKLNDNIEPGLKDYTITVNYISREIINPKDVAIDDGKKDIKITKWQAKLNVYFEEIYYDFEEREFNDLSFKVYGYDTKKNDG